MKSTKMTSLMLITAVAVTSLAAYAEIVTSMATFAEAKGAPVSSSEYPEIPAVPPYIYMGMSAYTAPL
ncbi:MAG: hypothetical protein KBA96_06605 [Rhodocyclaceae bacterium]|nr:hypothetical protein [Rhodocyclaceae bacterium]MBP7080763.1 hypothetical protein [Rhodocyclaceae bacterium]